jgi:hypothetical protein
VGLAGDGLVDHGHGPRGPRRHLGDTYYSGTPREARTNVLGLWPVPEGHADRVGSWVLMGNHCMYSGAHGFFQEILTDPRFVRQRTAAGEPTSWFALRTPSWNVLGLDTAWHDPLIELLHPAGATAVPPAPGDP